MSIICNLTVVSDDDILHLHDNPEFMDNLTRGQRTTCELDKAWQGIHWLLTGTVSSGDTPLCFLLSGGQEVSFGDTVYGPSRTLSSEEVSLWGDALSRIPSEELASRFNAKTMLEKKLYPEIWSDGSSLEYLLQRYNQLKDFVADAQKQNSGLLIYLT